MKSIVLPLGMAALMSTAGLFARTPAPDGVEAYIISPMEGVTVTSPLTVRFGLKGMGVAPAGVDKGKTGHHHLLVDLDKLPDMGMPIPSDQQHRHFGGGQTETTITLDPGQHSLQLLLGDMNHVPHQPAIKSSRIIIIVK